MERKIQLLRGKQEKQMAQLGQQKQQGQQRLAQLLRRREGLENALVASAVPPDSGTPLAWQNRSHWQEQLIPATQKLAVEQGLAEREQERLNRLWQQSLSRRQGLVWLEDHCRQKELSKSRKIDQSQQDEAGGRMVARNQGGR